MDGQPLFPFPIDFLRLMDFDALNQLIQNKKLFIAALNGVLLNIDITVQRKIQTDICEKIWPRLDVYISSSFAATPSNTPAPIISTVWSRAFRKGVRLLGVRISFNKFIILHSSMSMTAENKECYKLFEEILVLFSFRLPSAGFSASFGISQIVAILIAPGIRPAAHR